MKYYILGLFMALVLQASTCQKVTEIPRFDNPNPRQYNKQTTLQRVASIYNGVYRATTDRGVVNVIYRPIWSHEVDRYWVYEVQITTLMPSEPLAQRIFSIEKIHRDTFLRMMYKIPDERKYRFEWLEPKPFNGLERKDLAAHCISKVVRDDPDFLFYYETPCETPLAAQGQEPIIIAGRLSLDTLHSDMLPFEARSPEELQRFLPEMLMQARESRNKYPAIRLRDKMLRQFLEHCESRISRNRSR